MNQQIAIDVPFASCAYCKRMDILSFKGEHSCRFSDFCESVIGTYNEHIKENKRFANQKDYFGNIFKAICVENNITIKEVAEATGISQNTLYNMTKRNTKKPRGDKVERVLDYLQRRVPELTVETVIPIDEIVEEETYED